MSELEQRLTNELSKLAEQYGQDQKRLAGQCASLAGQVTRLEEQVRELAEQYAQAQTRVHPSGRTGRPHSPRTTRRWAHM